MLNNHIRDRHILVDRLDCVVYEIDAYHFLVDVRRVVAKYRALRIDATFSVTIKLHPGTNKPVLILYHGNRLQKFTFVELIINKLIQRYFA